MESYEAGNNAVKVRKSVPLKMQEKPISHSQFIGHND